jgi:hypothetical protein
MAAGRGELRSLTVAETSGTARAQLRIFDGDGSANGQQLVSYGTAASGGNTWSVGAGNLVFRQGLWLVVVSGAIEVCATVVLRESEDDQDPYDEALS